MSVSREKEREEEVRRGREGLCRVSKVAEMGFRRQLLRITSKQARKGGNKSNRRAGVTLAPGEVGVEIGADAKVGHFEEQPRLTPHPRCRIIIVTTSTPLLEKRLKYCIKTLTSHLVIIASHFLLPFLDS